MVHVKGFARRKGAAGRIPKERCLTCTAARATADAAYAAYAAARAAYAASRERWRAAYDAYVAADDAHHHGEHKEVPT